MRHANNFNLVRMIAATLVLVSHSYAIALGDPGREPLRAELGTTWGGIAVDIFFVTSGYLVTGSLFRRGGLLEFTRARALRIFPGLWVALLLTTIVISLAFTRLSPAQFWAEGHTWKFLATNMLLLLPRGLVYTLPQTFVGVPLSNPPQGAAVNGSLWSLPLEVRMYIILAVGYLVVRAVRRFLHKPDGAQDAVPWSLLAATAFSIGAFALDFRNELAGIKNPAPHVAAMFFYGSAIWLARVDLTRHRWLGAALLVLVLACAFIDRHLFAIVYAVSLPWIVLHAAYAPSGPLLAYNRLGDYSYGMYIYAFPVQQALAYGVPGIGPWTMTALAFAIVLVLAAASWHLVEKRALALKRSG